MMHRSIELRKTKEAAMSQNRFLLTLFMTAAACTAYADDDEAAWDVNAIPGDAQSISIDTREGTWMSLDVSPDGQTIAFDLLGDIYTLPMEGGEATAINSGLAWAMQPRFSPDGSEIAFTSDAGGGDNIWIMDADGGSPRQLTSESFRLLNNPYWSPDGLYIAARKHFTTTRSMGTGEIWLYHTQGGDGIQVIERPNERHQKELGEPAFSPDGRYLYFSLDSTPGDIFQYAQDSNGQIFEIRRHDLETGTTESFVTGPGGAVRPTPSPDGRYLAFVRRVRAKSALWLKDLESGEERPIYRDLDQDVQEVWAVQGVYPNMDWTPDSKQVVFWANGGLNRIDIASGETTSIDFHVNDTRTVYAAPRPAREVAPATFETSMARNVEVSPDGSKVAFETAGRIYVKSLPDGEPRLLTRNSGDHFEFDPSWSRDGRRIAFVTWDDVELGQVHSVAAGGGRSKQLTSRPGRYHSVRFSPDGGSVVYEASSGGYLTSPDWAIETGVFIVSSSGGPARRITADGSNPHFGAQSDRLYITRRDADGRSLVSVDLNGEAVRTHATGEYVTRFEVAPDDGLIAYRDNYHIFAVPFPPGGKPLSLSTSVTSAPMTRASGNGGNFPHFSNQGDTLNWALGATLFSVAADTLFTPNDGYTPPSNGMSLAMTLSADIPDGMVALTGARIVTMANADGGVIENGVVVVDGNRIAAVGDAGTAIPDDAVVIDVTGKTIMPGLIDAHAHGAQSRGVLIPEQNFENYATLALGVTTAFDPSNEATSIFAADEMQRTGRILAPRLFSTGNVVYGARSTYFADINSLDDAREHIRRLKAQGAIAIKNYNQPRREQRQQVTTAAREEGMLVVSEGGSLFHMDLSMVADGNTAIEHNLPQAVLYDDVLQFWRQTNVSYTPTLVVTYGGPTVETYFYQETEVWKHPILSKFVPPHILEPRSVRRTTMPFDDYFHVPIAAAAKALADEGVNVTIGAHGQREGLGSHWEMWGFAQGGMSPVEVIATATIRSAEKLGFDNDLGSLEAGKLADLIVLDANPLEDIFSTDKLTHVMLNGRLYEAATLNEVGTGDRQTAPFYWQ